MTRYRNMVSQVGRSAVNLRPRYSVLKSVRRGELRVGLIERERTLGGKVYVAYAIVFSNGPILPNGSILRHLPAWPNPLSKKIDCYCRDPEAWFGNLQVVTAEFEKQVRRSPNRRKARKPRPRIAPRSP